MSPPSLKKCAKKLIKQLGNFFTIILRTHLGIFQVKTNRYIFTINRGVNVFNYTLKLRPKYKNFKPVVARLSGHVQQTVHVDPCTPRMSHYQP